MSFRTCFAEDFDIRGVPKSWLEAPRVSFRTCFTGDFDNADAKTGIWAGWAAVEKSKMSGRIFESIFKCKNCCQIWFFCSGRPRDQILGFWLEKYVFL